MNTPNETQGASLFLRLTDLNLSHDKHRTYKKTVNLSFFLNIAYLFSIED